MGPGYDTNNQPLVIPDSSIAVSQGPNIGHMMGAYHQGYADAFQRAQALQEYQKQNLQNLYEGQTLPLKLLESSVGAAKAAMPIDMNRLSQLAGSSGRDALNQVYEKSMGMPAPGQAIPKPGQQGPAGPGAGLQVKGGGKISKLSLRGEAPQSTMTPPENPGVQQALFSPGGQGMAPGGGQQPLMVGNPMDVLKFAAQTPISSIASPAEIAILEKKLAGDVGMMRTAANVAGREKTNENTNNTREDIANRRMNKPPGSNKTPLEQDIELQKALHSMFSHYETLNSGAKLLPSMIKSNIVDPINSISDPKLKAAALSRYGNIYNKYAQANGKAPASGGQMPQAEPNKWAGAADQTLSKLAASPTGVPAGTLKKILMKTKANGASDAQIQDLVNKYSGKVN